MQSGARKWLWTIQPRTPTQNSTGEEVDSFSTNTSTAWGTFETIKGTEKWAAQQFIERALARVRFMYLPSINAEYRINNAVLGQYEVVGEPEHRPYDNETVVHVSKVVP